MEAYMYKSFFHSRVFCFENHKTSFIQENERGLLTSEMSSPLALFERCKRPDQPQITASDSTSTTLTMSFFPRRRVHPWLHHIPATAGVTNLEQINIHFLSVCRLPWNISKIIHFPRLWRTYTLRCCPLNSSVFDAHDLVCDGNRMSPREVGRRVNNNIACLWMKRIRTAKWWWWRWWWRWRWRRRRRRRGRRRRRRRRGRRRRRRRWRWRWRWRWR